MLTYGILSVAAYIGAVLGDLAAEYTGMDYPIIASFLGAVAAWTGAYVAISGYSIT